MVEKERDDAFLIMLCGLPGTGKTTVANKLSVIRNFFLVDQKKFRIARSFKIGVPVVSQAGRTMPKVFDNPDTHRRKINNNDVVNDTNRITADKLREGSLVVFDAVNKFSCRRQQLYGVASSCDARVLALEIVCPEEVAKQRMSERPEEVDFRSDPKDPKVYDKLRNEWESIADDFVHDSDVYHVSHIQYDSYDNKISGVIERLGMEEFITDISDTIVRN
jgi:predicted kinase